MWNEPTLKQLERIPKLYSTENVPLKEKVIHMHFFIGGCDWYVAEFTWTDNLFFGFAILNNDYEMAEWGYFSLAELASIKQSFVEVDRDKNWRPCKAIEVDKICKAQNWRKEDKS